MYPFLILYSLSNILKTRVVGIRLVSCINSQMDPLSVRFCVRMFPDTKCYYISYYKISINPPMFYNLYYSDIISYIYVLWLWPGMVSLAPHKYNLLKQQTLEKTFSSSLLEECKIRNVLKCNSVRVDRITNFLLLFYCYRICQIAGTEDGVQFSENINLL